MTPRELEKSLAEKNQDAWFSILGLEPDALAALRYEHRLEVLARAAKELFAWKDGDEFSVYSSPGRLVILGEFMEGMHGKVLGSPVSNDILAFSKPRQDRLLNFISWGQEEQIQLDLACLEVQDEESGEPASCIRGCAAILASHGFDVMGMDICIHSIVPSGNGLASFSAFVLLFARIFMDQSMSRPGKEVDDVFLARLVKQVREKWFGRTGNLQDPLLCLGGPVRYLDFTHEAPGIQTLSPSIKLNSYSVFLVETWEAFNEGEDERHALETELESVKKILAEFTSQDFFSVNPEIILSLARNSRDRLGERALLRALFLADEARRLELACKALESPVGIGTLIDIVNTSTSSAFRQLQNLWPETHPSSRGLVLGIELTERWLRSMGMPGAVHTHGKGFWGSFYALIPRNKADDYLYYIESFFGEGSAKLLSFRTPGVCRII